MSQAPIVRREALRRLAIFSTLVPVAALAACSKGPDCEDISSLTPEEKEMRKNAEYVPKAMQVAKKCDGCVQWIAPAPDQCGGCKVLKGPVAAEGTCKLFAPKPA